MLPISQATRPMAVPMTLEAKLGAKMLVLTPTWAAKPPLAKRPLSSCQSHWYA